MSRPPAAPPTFIEPCKPTLLPRPPSGARWVREVKFDGWRVGVRRVGRKVSFMSSGGLALDLGERLSGAVLALPATTLYLDAELVVENASGLTDFQMLQQDLGAAAFKGTRPKRTDRMLLYVFDLLWHEAEDLRPLPLIGRKTRLEQLLAKAPADALRYSEHFEDTTGQRFYEKACELGVEGVVSKVRDSRYSSGDSRSWAKAICAHEADVMIGGYQESGPGKVGAIFTGAPADGGKLNYRGHIDIQSEERARALAKRLKPLQQDTNPFADKSTRELRKRKVWFVKPAIGAKVRARGLTEAGRFRHPSLQAIDEPKRKP